MEREYHLIISYRLSTSCEASEISKPSHLNQGCGLQELSLNRISGTLVLEQLHMAMEVVSEEVEAVRGLKACIGKLIS